MWVYLLGTVVVVVLVVVLVSRMNAEPEPMFAQPGFEGTPARPPGPGLGLTFGF